MKTANFSSRIPNKIKSKDGQARNLEKGITKVLLDIYKPKILYKIGTFSEKNFQRIVA